MRTNRGEILTMVAIMVVAMGAVLIFGRKMCPMMGMKHDHSGHQQWSDSNNARVKPGHTYAKDLVCGMLVEISTSTIQTTRGDKTYYFCSKEDKEKFELQLDKYLKGERQ